MGAVVFTSSRVTMILSLVVVFMLVVATNRMDQHHFQIAQNSVNQMFKDRVLAQNYLFSMSRLLYQRRLTLLDSTVAATIKHETDRLSQLIAKYETTRLTPEEYISLKVFKKNAGKLKRLEKNQDAGFTAEEKQKEAVVLESMQRDLLKLSEIQVLESRRLTREAQNSLDLSQMLTHLEIGFLILIGMVLQILLFYRSKIAASVKEG